MHEWAKWVRREGQCQQVVDQLPVDLEEAKRFDLLILRLQHAILEGDATVVEQLRFRLTDLAGLLEDARAVPLLAAQLVLIQAMQTEDWWQGVTVGMLETARKRLRDLLQYIEKRKRRLVYTDFEDELGDPVPMDIGFGGSGNDERFQSKVKFFLHDHLGRPSLRKVYNNWPLTSADITDLQALVHEANAGSAADEARAAAEAGGVGLFVRSLVGLDRAAAAEAFATFLAGKQFNVSQIRFIDLLVNSVSIAGVLPDKPYYDSPITDIAPSGPEDLFTPSELAEMTAVLQVVRRNATAA